MFQKKQRIPVIGLEKRKENLRSEEKIHDAAQANF